MSDPSSCCKTQASPALVCCNLDTSIGKIPVLSTTLSTRDRIGGCKVRWGINRMGYRVSPGLYAVGTPDNGSPILVTANYKLTVDCLRSKLGGISVWLMILDTKGVNVWCAAGKGTFSTEELIQRIELTKLKDVAPDSPLIVPQLGATGVCGYEVQKTTGFKTVFGPVRAEDVPKFLANDMTAAPGMREVRFTFRDRAAVIPMELLPAAKYVLPFAVAMFVLSGITTHGFTVAQMLSAGWMPVLMLIGAMLCGTVAVPAFLPWIPGIAFSTKGLWAGLVWYMVLRVLDLSGAQFFSGGLDMLAWILLLASISSFLAMNFTGSSTYTSPSGVRAEMRRAVPLQTAACVVGALVWLIARFI